MIIIYIIIIYHVRIHKHDHDQLMITGNLHAKTHMHDISSRAGRRLRVVTSSAHRQLQLKSYN
jgi:hypothetical protein